MHTQHHNDFIRQKAIELLRFLDIPSPKRKQLHAIERLMRCWVIPVSLYFKEGLTPREQSCLWYAAKGFSVRKTADIMGIKHTTVKKYRENILQKTHCASHPGSRDEIRCLREQRPPDPVTARGLWTPTQPHDNALSSPV